MSSEGTPVVGGNGGGGAPWFDGLVPTISDNGTTKADPAFVGYIQNRGWDKFEPAKAAIAAMQAHQAAEKLIGAPANELLRMPKDAADADGWTRFNERVGVPKAATEYDFSSVKPKAGEMDKTLIDALAPAFQKAHVSKTDAPVVLKALVDYIDSQEGAGAQETEQALNNEREALKVSWGASAQQNTLVARNTAQTFGIDPKAVDALEKQIGYSKVMEMFLKIGQKTGEDKLILNSAPGGSGYLSGEQAQATLNEKMADSVWATKFEAGDAQCVKEFNNLTTLIAQSRRPQ